MCARPEGGFARTVVAWMVARDRASGTALCAVLGRSFLRERLLRWDVTGQRTEKPTTQDKAPSEPPIPVGGCSGMNRVPPKFMPTGTRVWPDLGIGCLKT